MFLRAFNIGLALCLALFLVARGSEPKPEAETRASAESETTEEASPSKSEDEPSKPEPEREEEVQPPSDDSDRPEPTGQLTVHFIDVGQGDAILIDHDTNELLIDGGRWGHCIDYLDEHVDDDLEIMVATHPNADHIGGLVNVLEVFNVQEVWHNTHVADTKTYETFMADMLSENAKIHEGDRGDQITLSDLTFEVLHPTMPLASNRNENSIVLSLSFGQVDFLFTGDIEHDAETNLVDNGLIQDIEILKVSHHGSKHCSCSQFLAEAQPEVAIYSAGANNPYGHPAPEAMSRLEDTGAKIYGTDVNGTVIVTTDGTTWEVNVEKAVQGEEPEEESEPEPTDQSDQEPEAGEGVCITKIYYDGQVPRVESDEYVEITNLGDETVNLEGWMLKDITDGSPSFTFPEYELDPGESIRVYTNEVHPDIWWVQLWEWAGGVEQQ
jgi:competence protein ComEC